MTSTIRRFLRIQYASDLHLEFFDKTPFQPLLKPVAPILVLAGDIGRPDMRSYRDFIYFCARNWEKVFVVAGNHELYNGKELRQSAALRLDMCETICGEWHNVHFMNRKSVSWGGVRFLGATLWTDMAGFHDSPYLQSRYNDFHRICVADDDHLRPVSLKDITAWHQCDITWLENEIPKTELPTVVITHHLPSYAMVSPRFAGDPINGAFATAADHLIVRPVKAWIAGHTHVGMTVPFPDHIMGLTNPLGYPGENGSGYSREMFVDVSLEVADADIPPTLALLSPPASLEDEIE
jgi:hypothetical protein